MAFFRVFFLLVFLGAIACFGLFIYTGDARYKRYGLLALKGVMIAGFIFFGVLIVQKLL